MSRQSELSSYIVRLQTRLRVAATLRGAAILAGTALVVTVALVLLLNRYAFPAHAVAEARWGLIAALAVCAALALVWPLLRLTRALAVRRAEAAHPALEQRLTTLQERGRDEDDPFLELLAADTLARTEKAAPPSSLASTGKMCALAGAGLACVTVLLWMIAAGPGYLGYGASLLWKGAKTNVAPMYAIAVTPGDVAVRRNSDQLIAAQITGLRPDKVQLFAHYGSTGGWEPVVMQPQPGLGGSVAPGVYQFLFAGLPQDVEYYVAAGPLVSPHYKVRVVDLPSIKGIQVTYHYPRWTGMKPVTEEHSGDLRAIEGTDAAIEVETDRPLKDGQLTLDGGRTIHLSGGEGNRYRGTIHMEKDGAYHLVASDAGQAVRLSEDYFIATDKAMPPEVAIERPGRDYRASPIEEVTVGVRADDTFGLSDVHLHYSVNGGPDRDVSLLKAPGAKNADGSYTLRLEDYKLVPGDLVSLYATAKDGHAETRTDITFIQADPFEREFSQSQQSGGGGGGGGGGGQNDQTEISKREKELIASTWKQVNDKTATPKDAAAQGQFLSDAQTKLRDQVMALSARMQSRDLSQANEEFTGFEKDMQTAAAAMAPSSDKLKGMEWKDALPLEQKALQSLLRAEATFRQIQVAFGQQGGGGGGGGNSAGRDLASLFDLELDTAKNQYETAQTASPAEQHAKDVEDTLEKLDALAKRQEELAGAEHNPAQSFQERWQQEMLRREAEQLQRQMEQLAQNSQNQQSQQGGQQGGQSSSNRSASGQSGAQSGAPSGTQSGSPSGSVGGQQQASSGKGEQSGSQGQAGSAGSRQQAGSRSERQTAGAAPDPRIAQALSRLRQAGEAMKRGSGANGTTDNGDAARQAADRLREATESLGGAQQQLASGKMGSLSHEADRLAQEERAQAERIDRLANRQGSYGADAAGMQARLRERDQLAAERQQLSNDLSSLQKSLRDSARTMAPNQPGAAQKLRDALTEMDQTDLDNHVQRTADWLRRGVNPNANGTENEIAQGLQKLDQQLRQAEQGLGQGSGSAGQRGKGQAADAGDQVAALNQVERLRGQLEAMARSQGRGGRDGQGNEGEPSSSSNSQGSNPQGSNPQGRGRTGQSGSQNSGQSGNQLSRGGQGKGQSGGQGSGQGQDGPSSSQGAQSGQGGQGTSGRAGSQEAQRGSGGTGRGTERGNDGGTERGMQAGNQSGTRDGGPQNGEVRFGGGGAGDTAWGNINTGNNQYAQGTQRPAPRDASENPADTERTYQQGMRELSQLRQMVGGDPRASKDLQELTRQMQRLDPSRFPGNPAMVEQMHREVLSAVDKLELQLNRDSSTDARTGKPDAVPAGYGDSVAEYYKKLSSNGRDSRP